MVKPANNKRSESIQTRDPIALMEYVEELQTQLAQAERDREIQSAVFRIAEIASSSEDMSEFYAALHQIVRNLTSTDAFFIATYHKEEHCVSYPYYEDPHDDAQQLDTLPLRNRELIPVEQLKNSLTWKVIRTNEVLRIYREPTDDTSMGIGKVSEDWLGIPLRQNGKPIGVVAIQSYESGFRYTDTEVEMMVFMANHIGTALHCNADATRLILKKLTTTYKVRPRN